MARAEFTVTGGGVLRARLYIAGLGYYRSWINGAATDSHVLGTFTTFEQRVLYVTLPRVAWSCGRLCRAA